MSFSLLRPQQKAQDVETQLHALFSFCCNSQTLTTLVDKIHTEPMQYQTPEHEIRKSPLTADMARILLQSLPRFRHGLRSAGGRGWGAFTCLHA